ncbi:MAG: hypothetical protein ACYDIB_05585 [Desulfobulbia bacterium]
MTTKSDYGKVASEIAKHLNAFRLAFKTYNVSEFDEMIKIVAGPGARVSGAETANEFQTALLERGFIIYPTIQDSEDGYLRVIRANSIVGNLLNAFRYVGHSGDDDLARLLTNLKTRKRVDDMSSDSPDI